MGSDNMKWLGVVLLAAGVMGLVGYGAGLKSARLEHQARSVVPEDFTPAFTAHMGTEKYECRKVVAP